MAYPAGRLGIVLTAITLFADITVNPAVAGSNPYQYKTACGPIAAFVALQQLNRPATLDEVVSSLGWSEGSLTKLQTIRDFLSNQSGLTCSGVRVSPAQMQDLVNRSQAAVIIAIRKGSEEINHAVCVRTATPRYIEYVDYPELVVRVPMAMLPDIWDGQALVVHRDRWDPVLAGILALDGVLIATAVCVWAHRSATRRRGGSLQDEDSLSRGATLPGVQEPCPEIKE